MITRGCDLKVIKFTNKGKTTSVRIQELEEFNVLHGFSLKCMNQYLHCTIQ